MADIRCVVDWPGTMSFVKDLVVAGAAIFTATVAYKGIDKWRGEESGKADFELARRVGKAVFRMRDALAQARGAFLFAGEFPNDYNPHEKHKEADAYAYLFSGRFEPVRLAAREIETLRNEAEALWGRDVVTKLNRLLAAAKTLRVAQYVFVDKKREHGTIDNAIQSRLFDESFETDEQGNVVDKPNPFTVEIENAVEDLSAYLRIKLPRHA